MSPERIAVFTTVYPAAGRYLSAWYESVRQQTDQGFDLWIGLDDMTPARVAAAIGEIPEAHWIAGAAGDSPAAIRQAAIDRLVAHYDAVVFVDCDDLLYPSRVAAARAALAACDVVACALDLVDESARPLGRRFAPPEGADTVGMLARCNVFGLSNTAYCCSVLERCRPIPADCQLQDWLLATRAWGTGARLRFESTARMAYRQHGNNVARVEGPFTGPDVLQGTERVRNHYRCVLQADDALDAAVRAAVRDAATRVEAFHAAVTGSEARLLRYVEALNRLPPLSVWWWWVAHPDLEGLWRN
jgi:hypothetical protein